MTTSAATSSPNPPGPRPNSTSPPASALSAPDARYIAPSSRDRPNTSTPSVANTHWFACGRASSGHGVAPPSPSIGRRR